MQGQKTGEMAEARDRAYVAMAKLVHDLERAGDARAATCVLQALLLARREERAS